MPTQALIAQSSLPSLGDDTAMTLGAERRLGDQIGKEIYADSEYLSDPVLDAYLQSLWLPLMAAARQRGDLPPEMQDALAWRLFLIRDKSVNAFALPGGYFGVHLGLMALVDTPDELASVLAHELTHVTQRHIARGMTKQSAQSPWLMAGAILAILAASRSTNANTDAVSQGALAATQAAGLQNRLNFSRDMEREADRLGFNLMQPAGYAPEGFVGMFGKLAVAARLNDNGNFPYLRSHPLTTERIADIGLRVQEQQRLNPSAVGASANSQASAKLALHRLMAARASVLSDGSVDALRRHVNKGSSTAARTDLPALYAAALAAWQLKDAPLAARLYQQLQAAALAAPQTPRIADALRWLGADLQLDVPLDLGSPARADVLYAAQVALRKGLPADKLAATARLQEWLSANAKDGEAWALQSSLQQANGQRLRAAMSAAEAKSAWLDDSGALASYQAAQNLIRQGTPADAIDMAIVDSKVRELQRRVRERVN